MKIKKKVQGKTINLEFIKIKEYPKYSLYQVYKIIDKKRILLYKECYTDPQIREIIDKGYWVTKEAFV